MNRLKKEEFLEIAKEFVSGFDFPLNGSGFLIVDPLSAYLNSIGYKNTLVELKATEIHPQVLIIVFNDGTQIIPAGADLKRLSSHFKNWHWVDSPIRPKKIKGGK